MSSLDTEGDNQMNRPLTAITGRRTRAAMLSTGLVLTVALTGCGGSSDENGSTTTTSEPATTSESPTTESLPEEDAGGSSEVLEEAIAEDAQFTANDGPERTDLPELTDGARVGDEIWFGGEEDGDAVMAVVDAESLAVETITLGNIEGREVSRLAVGSDTVWAQLMDRNQVFAVDIESHEVKGPFVAPEVEAAAEAAADLSESPEGLFVVDDAPWYAAGKSLFALDPSDPAQITDTIDLAAISAIDPSFDIEVVAAGDLFLLSASPQGGQGGPTFILDPDTGEVEELDSVSLEPLRTVHSLPSTEAGVVGPTADSELAVLDLEANEAELLPIGLTGAVFGLDAVGNVAAIATANDTLEAFDVSTGESTELTLDGDLDGNQVLVVGDSLWTWTRGRVVVTILTPE